jgi:hypothetical protein
MKTLKLSLKETPYLSNLFTSFYKKKSNNDSFIKWFLVYYFGASTLLLLSLHSYCMGSVF